MFLVDTNVLSETTRRQPDPGVLDWLARREVIHVAAVSIQELSFGVETAPEGRQGPLREWLDTVLASSAIEVVPFDRADALECGRLLARRRAAGIAISVVDAQIAGTALARSAVLVTRNTKDFEGLGLPLLNPFSDGWRPAGG